MMRYRIKRVVIMAALAKKTTSDNTKKPKLAKASALHTSICEKISTSGITPEQIEKDVYEAYLDVKKVNREC